MRIQSVGRCNVYSDFGLIEMLEVMIDVGSLFRSASMYELMEATPKSPMNLNMVLKRRPRTFRETA
jgi:hypothetical protein